MLEKRLRLNDLENFIGYKFTSQALLEQALTHRSCGSKNNERLEYLGDAFLNFTLASYLYQNASLCQGQLSRARAYLVSKEQLLVYAELINLSSFIKLAQRIKISDSAVADAFEALLGSLVIDAGFHQAQKIFFSLFSSFLATSIDKALQKDPKTLLQEISQKKFKILPVYQLLKETGNGHRLVFHVQCQLPGYSTIAKETSLKSAQSLAAEKMLKVIDNEQKK